MSEYVRSVSIRVEVDTNKITHRLEATSIVELLRWAAGLDPEILAVLMSDEDSE